MRYAIIKDSIVINVIVWDGESDYDPGENCTLVQSDSAGIGDTYDGETFTPSAS